MPQAAGNIDIVLSLKKGQYTAAMREAQGEARKLGLGMKSAGHTSITSVQAISANLRAMEGGFNNNLRAVERWIAQSKVATSVAQNMFPIVGAFTFGGMVVDMGLKVAEFIKKTNEMPKAIERGFASMNLASQSSTDALRLTNDQLQNAINKLEGKPTNNLVIQFDEARKAADKLATSIEAGNSKLNELLSKNHLSGWTLLMGKVGTADREGTAKAFSQQSDDNAYELANANASGDPARIAKAQKALKDTQNAQLAEARRDLANRQAAISRGDTDDESSNMNIDKGIITTILNQQNEQVVEERNATLSAKKQKLDDAKAESEAAKKAAHDRIQVMQDGLAAMKLAHGMSLKATFDYWDQMKAGELAGSTAYNDIVKMQAQLSVEGATQAHTKFAELAKKMKDDAAESSTTGPEIINRSSEFARRQATKTSREQDEDYRDNNQLFIDGASNTAREKEAQITDAAGRSMTRYAAAIELTKVHADELKATLEGLQADIDNAQRNYDAVNTAGGDPDEIRQAKRELTRAQRAYGSASVQGGIQAASDKQATNPAGSSALVGATDALNEFVEASRNAAQQMRDVVSNTLNGLNNQIVNAMTGQRGSFRQLGMNVTRNLASVGLQKAEGALIGKMGTQANPMWTKSADGVGGGAEKAGSGLLGLLTRHKSSSSALDGAAPKAAGGFLGFLGKLFGGGASGGSGVATTPEAIPFPMFADGGSISGPAIVGERGPELFIPPGKGTIIPNHKLAAGGSGSSSSAFNYTIDARGTDPVQTEMRVKSALVAVHKSSVHQSLVKVHQQAARRPARSR